MNEETRLYIGHLKTSEKVSRMLAIHYEKLGNENLSSYHEGRANAFIRALDDYKTIHHIIENEDEMEGEE